MEHDMATLIYRIDRLDKDHGQTAHDLERLERQVAVHDEQISGAGGIVRAMDKLGKKVDSLNKALYAFAGSFIVAAVTIAIAIGGGH